MKFDEKRNIILDNGKVINRNDAQSIYEFLGRNYKAQDIASAIAEKFSPKSAETGEIDEDRAIDEETVMELIPAELMDDAVAIYEKGLAERDRTEELNYAIYCLNDKIKAALGDITGEE